MRGGRSKSARRHRFFSDGGGRAAVGGRRSYKGEAGRGGDVLTAGGEDEDSGRPNWLSEDLECASSKQTRINKNLQGGGRWGATFRRHCTACGRRTECQPASRGLMPSGGLQAVPLHYPKMVKSISSNYINHTEICSFYGNTCESFRSTACQVLNIAGRVMCHCQTNM